MYPINLPWIFNWHLVHKPRNKPCRFHLRMKFYSHSNYKAHEFITSILRYCRSWKTRTAQEVHCLTIEIQFSGLSKNGWVLCELETENFTSANITLLERGSDVKPRSPITCYQKVVNIFHQVVVYRGTRRWHERVLQVQPKQLVPIRLTGRAHKSRPNRAVISRSLRTRGLYGHLATISSINFEWGCIMRAPTGINPFSKVGSAIHKYWSRPVAFHAVTFPLVGTLQ